MEIFKITVKTLEAAILIRGLKEIKMKRINLDDGKN